MGQVARYLPDRGWEPESLLSGHGHTVDLEPARGRLARYPVAPTRSATPARCGFGRKGNGLWEPDPGAPPHAGLGQLHRDRLRPQQPESRLCGRQQGLLLGLGRRPGLRKRCRRGCRRPKPNFSSVTFAGDEALATYKFPITRNTNVVYSGGVLSNDGSGWQVDQGAQAALGGAVPQRVAGLPDGGAVIASLGLEGGATATPMVIERQGPGAAWQAAPGGAPRLPDGAGGGARSGPPLLNARANVDIPLLQIPIGARIDG